VIEILDCKKYSSEVEKINKTVGEKYKDVFTTNKEEIRKIKEEIMAALKDKVDEKALDCFIYQKLSLGSLTPFLLDDNLEEIMVIGHGSPVYIFDRDRGAIATDVVLDESEIRSLINRVANFSGRAVDNFNPLLDGRLPDGSRVNATISSVTPKGSTITIRKFNIVPLTVLDLLRFKTLDPKLASFLWLVVEGLGIRPANILIIGGTASGKTTTLNSLSSFIPDDARIISIEDTLEISIRHKHWIPMETKPPDQEGKKEVTMDALLKNALRMRPDRIIVGEVRAEEALTLFTAMNTGHDGCLATLHANSAREALARLQGHPMNVPSLMLPALDLIVAQKRYTEKGKLVRKVFEVAELAGKEAETFLMNTLFSFDAKTGRLENKILNGRIIQELSSLGNFSIKELDEEMYKRELVLELMVDYDLTQKDIHRFVQDYYKHQYRTLEELHDEIKTLKKISEGETKSLLKLDKKWKEKEQEW
jgi:flagellar protein FlaI